MWLISWFLARLLQSQVAHKTMIHEKAAIVAQTTPSGRRWPWLAAALVVPVFAVFGVVAAFGTVEPDPEPLVTRAVVVEPLTLSGLSASNPLPAAPYFQEERFLRGDTVAALIGRLGVDEEDARKLIRSAGSARIVRLLRPGTTVQATTRDGKLQSLRFLSGRDSLVTVERQGDSFTGSESRIEPTREVELRAGQIVS